MPKSARTGNSRPKKHGSNWQNCTRHLKNDGGLVYVTYRKVSSIDVRLRRHRTGVLADLREQGVDRSATPASETSVTERRGTQLVGDSFRAGAGRLCGRSRHLRGGRRSTRGRRPPARYRGSASRRAGSARGLPRRRGRRRLRSFRRAGVLCTSHPRGVRSRRSRCSTSSPARPGTSSATS